MKFDQRGVSCFYTALLLVDYAKVVVVALFFVCEECFGGKGRKFLETGRASLGYPRVWKILERLVWSRNC